MTARLLPGRGCVVQLSVDYDVHAIESILRYVAPALGWR